MTQPGFSRILGAGNRIPLWSSLSLRSTPIVDPVSYALAMVRDDT
jgi:hypothetical protein